MDSDDKNEIARLEARLNELRAKAEPEATKAEPYENTLAPQSSKPEGKGNGVVIVVATMVVVVGGLIALSSRTTPDYSAADKALNDHTAALMARTRAASGSATPMTPAGWDYSSSADPMTDRKTENACVTSTNQVLQTSPYSNTTARLCIRQSPRYGLDAYVVLNGEGQILCRSYDGCAFKVRFDQSPQQSFSGGDSADGSSNIVFIRNAQRFVTSAKAADVTRIEIQLYRGGNQILEFPTKGLVWPRPSSPS